MREKALPSASWGQRPLPGTSPSDLSPPGCTGVLKPPSVHKTLSAEHVTHAESHGQRRGRSRVGSDPRGPSKTRQSLLTRGGQVPGPPWMPEVSSNGPRTYHALPCMPSALSLSIRIHLAFQGSGPLPPLHYYRCTLG